MKRICAACLVLALPLLSSCALVPQEEVLPQMPVIQEVAAAAPETVEVLRGDLSLEKVFSCSYKPAEEEKLYFPINGQAIEAIYVQVGDTVKKGDLMAELNNTNLLQQIENQNYTMDSLELQILQQQNYIATQKQRIEILTELAKTDPSYDASIHSAQQNIASRNSQLTLLFAQLSVEQTLLDELEAELKQRQLYAGIDGTVSYTLDLGDTTVYTKNHLICTIQNLGDASFVGFFPEGLISLEQKLFLKDNNGKEMEVIARHISEPDSNGNCSVSFALLTPDSTLKTGSSARVTLVSEHLEDVLYLPSSAVHTKEAGSFVYYLDENGLIGVKEVQVGPTINKCTQIISGLEEGELVLPDAP